MADVRGLAADQNSRECLRLLAAKSQLYLEAEYLGLIRTAGAIALLVVGPILVIVWPALTGAVATIGIVFTLVAVVWLARLETTKVRQAALVQEQFDTEVFGLTWNDNFVGRKVLPDVIVEAERGYKGDLNRLRGWYPTVVSSLPRPLAVLVCQRANAVWDARQRRRFALYAAIGTALLVIAGVAIGVLRSMTLLEYLFGILSPSLAAYIEGARLAETQRDAATEKDAVESAIASVWERAMNRATSVDLNDCRQVQDRIFSLRLAGPVTPAWLYGRLRPSLQKDMEAVAAQLTAEAENELRKQQPA